jgi:aryl-alcohol dehydrogenase-like predicted oxidoreductase
MPAEDFLTTIGPEGKAQCALGLGCWVFGGAQWGGQEDADSMSAMQAALDSGLNHFDTATGYGNGRSETLVGDFLQGKREEVYLASKFFPSEPTADYAYNALELSLTRLGTDYVDLYYIHWPRTGADLRPVMEGLERAREHGKLRAIGVSNFNLDQMGQVMEVGTIDAHQLCYNLFWRFAEREIIPFCVDNNISVVTYSSLAQGILTGKFARNPEFREGDSRAGMVFFDDEVWPHVYESVETLKKIAENANWSLTHLAIRWAMDQPGIASVLVGARDDKQIADNAAALDEDPPEGLLDRMTIISEDLMPHIPDVGNIFRFYP